MTVTLKAQINISNTWTFYTLTHTCVQVTKESITVSHWLSHTSQYNQQQHGFDQPHWNQFPARFCFKTGNSRHWNKGWKLGRSALVMALLWRKEMFRLCMAIQVNPECHAHHFLASHDAKNSIHASWKPDQSYHATKSCTTDTDTDTDINTQQQKKLRRCKDALTVHFRNLI